MENLNFEDFWRHYWWFLENFWGILENILGILESFCQILEILNFVRKTSNILNFVRRTSRFQIKVLKSEVLRPLWPPNSLGGQIWPQIWNLWPKLHMLPCLFWLFWPFFCTLTKDERTQLTLLDLSTSPQVKTVICLCCCLRFFSLPSFFALLLHILFIFRLD